MKNALLTAVLAAMIGVTSINAAKPKATPPPTLSERYDKSFCAVVQLSADAGSGTGFFISAQGDILTASHVALNKQFSQPSPGQIRLDIDYKPGLRVVHNGETSANLNLPKLGTEDVQRAIADLVILKTGIKTSCYLPLSAHPQDARIGEHVIAIGFPLSAPSGALYEGFVSAQYRHLPIPMATVNGIPIYPSYDVIRIQMPITPGASGGPVIADDGDVIGVVSENPTAWFSDLNALIEYGQRTNGGFNAPESDLPKLVAKLAWVVQEFVTSGAGLAVPVSYLKQPEPTPSPVGTLKAPARGSQPRLGWFQSLIAHLK